MAFPQRDQFFQSQALPVPWLNGEIVNQLQLSSECLSCLLAGLLATKKKKNPDCSIYMDKATGSVVADPYALCLKAEWLPPSFGKHIVSWRHVSPAAFSF